MQAPQRLGFGSFYLDLRDERLWCGHEVVRLPPKCFAVLRCLVAQAGRLVTKDALLATVWPETVVSEDVLTVAIRQLRRVLGDRVRTPRFIETVHGRGYRFIAPVSALASSEGSTLMGPPRPVPPPLFRRPPHFVGRDTALAQLAQWWSTARQGTRQVGMIVGELGIGKTALVEAFLAQVAATEDVWVGHGQCIDHYGAGEAYLPVLEALGRLGRDADGERLVACLRHYAPSWLVQMPALLPSAAWEALQRTAGEATPTRMLRELTEALDALTAERPLMLVLEDLHWSDMATLEWLTYVARRRDPARLLLLGTYRPVDAMVRAHPVRTVMRELTQHQQGAELPLDYLAEAEVTAYLSQRFVGLPRVADVARLLHQRTRGHPLFLVTMLDEMRRQGLLPEEATGWDVSKTVETIRRAVPESLRHIIEQQLQQVSLADQGLLEAASLAGLEFSAPAIAAVVTQATEDIEVRLAALAHHGQFIRTCSLVEWPDGTVAAGYGFRHDLYREILYDRVPPSRQRRWHLQIGVQKETGYGAQAWQIAAELAVHFARGGDHHRALQYLQHAADNALRRFAYSDAITHLSNALTLLATLPEAPAKAQQELDLHVRLGPPMIATKGYAAVEVERIYTRARALCHQMEDTALLFPVLSGLKRMYSVRAAHQTAHALGEQLLAMAQHDHEDAWLLEAQFGVGCSLYYLGHFRAARAHFAQGHTLYEVTKDPMHAVVFGQAPGATYATFEALVLWALGYPDQARCRSHEGVRRARTLGHPFSLVFALHHGALLHAQRREVDAVQTLVAEALACAREHDFAFWMAWGLVLQGWATAVRGEAETGRAQIRQGIDMMHATGAALERPYILALFAETWRVSGHTAASIALLDEALTIADDHGERYWEAELYRLKGELLWSQSMDNHVDAERYLHQALAIACRQQAKSLELRAALSLSRLWQQQGKWDEARALLAPIYEWFTEGFDTADLQEAKALLEERGSSNSRS